MPTNSPEYMHTYYLANKDKWQEKETMPVCAFDGCNKLARKRGYCDTCYHRLRRDGTIPMYKTYRRTKDPLYWTWRGMIARCHQRSSVSWHSYGGRGIKVCEQWRHNFDQFATDMGPKPTGLTLDRIDNDGNYSPENCRWVSYAEQNRNSSRNHIINGVCITDLARQHNINVNTLSERLKSGWPLEYALNTPAGMGRPWR